MISESTCLGTDSSTAMDLSLRNCERSVPPSLSSSSSVNIIKPIPRPPWSIVWYRNLWNLSNNQVLEGDNNGPGCKDRVKVENRNSTVESRASSPLTTSNYLKSSNTIVSRPSTYNFSIPPYLLSQTQKEETFVGKSATINLPSECDYRYKRNLQENYDDDEHPDHHQKQHRHQRHCGTVTNDTDQNCSCSSPISVDEDDLGNESENSENIVVTTITEEEESVSREDNSKRSLEKYDQGNVLGQPHNTVILDVACCDGPVQFKRVSNPNFAVTVEHTEPACSTISSSSLTGSSSSLRSSSLAQHQSDTSDMRNKWFGRTAIASCSSSTSENLFSSQPEENECGGGVGVTMLKSYLCIYCNQSFKSLFCYQKHKKRHLNPVSVDITTTMENSTSHHRPITTVGGICENSANTRRTSSTSATVTRTSKGNLGSGQGPMTATTPTLAAFLPETTKAKTKDLNVQFFPCKKCGSKFPSYYFVHKHRKICH